MTHVHLSAGDQHRLLTRQDIQQIFCNAQLLNAPPAVPCCRELRQQVEDKGFDDLDLGPDEHQLQLADKELHSAQQKEINRLREDLGQATNELEALKLRVSGSLDC